MDLMRLQSRGCVLISGSTGEVGPFPNSRLLANLTSLQFWDSWWLAFKASRRGPNLFFRDLTYLSQAHPV